MSLESCSSGTTYYRDDHLFQYLKYSLLNIFYSTCNINKNKIIVQSLCHKHVTTYEFIINKMTVLKSHIKNYLLI